MLTYVETLYTENNLSIGGICAMTNLTRSEVVRMLTMLELL
jgi:DNA-binding IclR family transcriptional regulator